MIARRRTHDDGRLPFLRRAGPRPRRLRRGVSLLPGLFTIGNMFCGYACVVHAARDEFQTAAVFIGIAIVVDMLDGRIARLTGTESDFGAELDSLADVISFGIAPAILAFGWGLAPLGRLGWAASFLYVAAAAMRLARFNIQSTVPSDKRYFVGMPSPPAAGVIAATVFAYPAGLSDLAAPWLVLAMVLVPAFLMISTIRFRSFKTIDLRMRRPYTTLLLIAAGLVLIVIEPRIVLAAMAYTYLASAFVGMAITRLRHRGGAAPADAGGSTHTDRSAAAR
jgi:CDP-diacylglycerol--serine O-phosphatidyltransferase